MRFDWLHRDRASPAVIVVFGGWAIGPQVLAHLAGGQDVLFASDYRDLDAFLPDLSGYAQRALVAWSFGVAAYGHWQAGLCPRFDRCVAINGSLTPVHGKTGIPPRIFRQTVEELSPASFQSFLDLCFDAPQPAQPFDTSARRAELLAVERRGDAPGCHWDRIWISDRDRIFPPQNLDRAWAAQPGAIRRINAPHVPFAQWSDWSGVLA